MKSNFGLEIKPRKTTEKDSEAEFEQMLIDAGCLGSYMTFVGFLDNEKPKHMKIIDELAREKLYPQWLSNFGKNFWRFKDAPKLEELKEERFRKRAIIIGGGPSLERNKNLLSKAEDYDIFCCDRSLERINIEADYGVSVDAHPTVANYYKNNNYKHAILPATCDPSTVPDKYNFYYIPSIDQQTDKIMQLMTGLPIIISQGNANGVCCALAEWLGYEELVLLGYDLAYEVTEKGVTEETEDQTEDWKFWLDRFKASGASEETIKRAYTQGEHPIFKTKYLSDIVFDAYRMAFYNWVKQTKCKIINASEGGSVFHEKIECRKFEEIIN